MSEAMIVEAVRTPFGRRGGALRAQRPDALLAHVIDGLLDRTGIDARKIEDVIDGTVTLAGEQGANPARLAVLLSRLPVEVPGVSLNRMCGSSQQAVHFAAQAVAAGQQAHRLGVDGDRAVLQLQAVGQILFVEMNGHRLPSSASLAARYLHGAEHL